MKIVLYTRRNVGLYCLSHLVALGYNVSVITDDKNVEWLAGVYGCDVVDFNTMGEFDFLFCIHGNRILPKEILQEGKMVNIHPALYLYRGQNPIKRFIFNNDTEGSVESQWLIEEVDGGEVIHQEKFETPVCKNYADYYNVALPYYFTVISETLKKIVK